MKYYLVTGEPSGERHARALAAALRRADPAAELRISLSEDGAVMGLKAPFRQAGAILRRLGRCQAEIDSWRPDAVIPVDYPTFNLRIARHARRRGCRVCWYIAPKTWASREGRIRPLRRDVDRLLVIFPFEEEYFRQRGVNALYVGNPLLDAPVPAETREAFLQRCGLPEGKYIALLPGSRRAELETMLPPLAAVADALHGEGWHFLAAGAPGREEREYAGLLTGRETFVHLLFNETAAILRHAEAAVVNSGTASLEAALAGTPQLVGYRTDALTWALGKRLVKVPWISLPNLLLGREAVKELLQVELTADAIVRELRALTADEALRERMRGDCAALHALLGGPGAADNAARAILASLSSSENEITGAKFER